MKKSTTHIVLISLIVALGGFLMGFDASVISGVVKFIEPEFGLSKIELGWAVSSLTLTATIAMIFAGTLSDKIGRRKVLFIAAALYAISAIFSAIAPNFLILVIARMIGGFGVGASLIIAPMYIAEISPPKIRGTMVSFNQLNIVLGISVAFFSNYLILQLGKSGINWAETLGIEKHNWRYMLGIEAFPAILYFLFLFIVPKSPRWLIMKNRESEALTILKKANGNDFSAKEIESIKQSLISENQSKKARLFEIFRKSLRPVLTIGIVLAVVQQLTGINSVFFYAPMIFEQSGLGVDTSFSQAIYVGLTNLIFTIVAMLLIDKIGRKPLLIIGVTGIAVSMLVLAYNFNSASYSISEETINSISEITRNSKIEYIAGKTFSSEIEFKHELKKHLGAELFEQNKEYILKKSININSILILVAILIFVASFAVSIGPVMWVMFSELFPNMYRALAISFVGFINSVVSFIVQLVFPWELENFGSALTFLIYGIFAGLGLIFIILKVRETKGKSLEELQTILIKKKIDN